MKAACVCFCVTLTTPGRTKCHCPTCTACRYKARPLCFACKTLFFFLQQACYRIVSVCLQILIIYVISYHLVCQWLNLLGLHFLVFTPTRAQAPGWLYNLWHTFLGITNIKVVPHLSHTFHYYKLLYKVGSSVSMPFPCLSVCECLFGHLMLSVGVRWHYPK